MAVLKGVILAGVRCKSDGDQTIEMEIVVDPNPCNGGAFCDALRESSKVVILQGKDRLEYLEWVARQHSYTTQAPYLTSPLPEGLINL